MTTMPMLLRWSSQWLAVSINQQRALIWPKVASQIDEAIFARKTSRASIVWFGSVFGCWTDDNRLESLLPPVIFEMGRGKSALSCAIFTSCSVRCVAVVYRQDQMTGHTTHRTPVKGVKVDEM
uniref:Putative secreted protein n=1 Tax=Anopheles marajoara TaxID=58244 RepID=A0A2M4C778_9DIPT